MSERCVHKCSFHHSIHTAKRERLRCAPIGIPATAHNALARASGNDFCVLAGVSLAIDHHLYYSSLDGNEVPEIEWNLLGGRVSKQQLNTAAGTAMAFMVKAFLVLAISTAYVQGFWNATKSHDSKGPMTVAQLDAAHSVTRNLLALLDRSMWTRHPILVFLGLTIWYES